MKKWLVAMPLALLAAILGMIGFTRGKGLKLWLDRRGPRGPMMPIEMSSKVDYSRKRISIELTNATMSSIQVDLSSPKWNDAPMREGSRNLVLGPFETRRFSFHPIHDDVPSYGTVFEGHFSYKAHGGNGGMAHNNGTNERPAFLMQPGGEIVVVQAGSDRRCFAEVFDIRVAVAGKGVSQVVPNLTASGAPQRVASVAVTGRKKNDVVVKFKYRLTPWSPVKSETVYL